MSTEHPFAQYIRILGKGPTLSRPLTRQETLEAARMLLSGAVEPVQMGAFLCLLRVKTETPEEMAGFAQAAKESVALPANAPEVDLDWSSYAGKSRRLPWFLLSALLLARNGVRVFMHGAEGHTSGRIYASEALAALGVPVAASLAEAAGHIAARNFAYMKLEHLSPRLHEIMGLRALLGLRSPIHSVARMMNPLGAPYEVVGVAHPHYRPVHQEAAHLLGQKHLAVFKGEGGEVERRPEKACLVFGLHGDEMRQEEWAPLPVETPAAWDDMQDLGRLKAVWSGADDDAYAVATITGTAAIVLRMMGRAASPGEADRLAADLWANRDRGPFG